MFLSIQQCRPGKSAVQPFSGCMPTELTIPLNLAQLPCSLRFRLSPPPRGGYSAFAGIPKAEAAWEAFSAPVA
jgi:hypothetical protein